MRPLRSVTEISVWSSGGFSSVCVTGWLLRLGHFQRCGQTLQFSSEPRVCHVFTGPFRVDIAVRQQPLTVG